MDKTEIMRRLEELTPGGSEFHNAPDRCFTYIEECIRSGQEAKKETVKLRRAVNERDEFVAVCEAVANLANGQGRLNLLEVAGQARAALAKATGD